MEALARTAACRHATLRIASRHATEFVDLTERLEELVSRLAFDSGIMNVQTRHTTTALVVNEHEPLLLGDFQALLEAAAPRDRAYRHDDATLRTVNLTTRERTNGHSHCRALLLPTSATLNVIAGRLDLGRWQRVLFVELDGPQVRQLSITCVGESRP